MTLPVTLQTGEVIIIDNGLVRLGIREDGILQELSLRGGPNLASSGYWNCNGNGYDAAGAPLRQKFSGAGGPSQRAASIRRTSGSGLRPRASGASLLSHRAPLRAATGASRDSTST